MSAECAPAQAQLGELQYFSQNPLEQFAPAPSIPVSFAILPRDPSSFARNHCCLLVDGESQALCRERLMLPPDPSAPVT
eukprot:m.553911 g.553911  ORF g.553911 m.553911 type:complete len:79 (+) comp57743_c0_seq30:1875-2111(+)